MKKAEKNILILRNKKSSYNETNTRRIDCDGYCFSLATIGERFYTVNDTVIKIKL